MGPRRDDVRCRLVVVQGWYSPFSTGRRLIRAGLVAGWNMKNLDLDRRTVETAYARWAPIYDAVCGPVMVKGRRAAAAAGRGAGGQTLGVRGGAGLSFD